MRAPHIKLSFCLCLLFLFTETSIAQKNNSTEYPYGGVYSLGRLTFKEKANFIHATFDSVANFRDATFEDVTFFQKAVLK